MHNGCNLRATSEICYKLIILPPKRTKNTKKGPLFCPFGALQLLRAAQILHLLSFSVEILKMGTILLHCKTVP